MLEELKITHLSRYNMSILTALGFSVKFDSVLCKAAQALVVFYAPWSGLCKRIKPEIKKAATIIKKEQLNGIVVSLDTTPVSTVASRYGVKVYPTLKYYNSGKFKYDSGHARQEEQIVNFIKNAQELPPPPLEKVWSVEDSLLRHLNGYSFSKTLGKIKHAARFFYAQWCRHCKSTEPELVKTAEQFVDELLVVFGVMHCLVEQQLYANYDVTGCPTIKYFSYFDKLVHEYNGEQKEADFVSFIHSQRGEHETSQKSEMTSQQAGFGVNVQIATDADFLSIISSPKPTFVMIYATWCGHCSTVKPAFSRLATAMKSDNSPVNVIAVEAVDNPKVADFTQVETLPTFKLYANGRHVADYDGDRTQEDMFKFCMSHV